MESTREASQKPATQPKTTTQEPSINPIEIFSAHVTRIKSATQTFFKGRSVSNKIENYNKELDHIFTQIETEFDQLEKKIEQERNVEQLYQKRNKDLFNPEISTLVEVQSPPIKVLKELTADNKDPFPNLQSIDEVMAELFDTGLPEAVSPHNLLPAKEKETISKTSQTDIRNSIITSTKKGERQEIPSPLTPALSPLVSKPSRHSIKLKKAYNPRHDANLTSMPEAEREKMLEKAFSDLQWAGVHKPIPLSQTVHETDDEIDQLLAETFKRPQPVISDEKAKQPLPNISANLDSDLKQLGSSLSGLKGGKNKLIYIGERGFVSTERLSKMPIIKRWMAKIQNHSGQKPLISSKTSLLQLMILADKVKNEGNNEQALKLRFYIRYLLNSPWGHKLLKEERALLNAAYYGLKNKSVKKTTSTHIEIQPIKEIQVPALLTGDILHTVKDGAKLTPIFCNFPEALLTADQAVEFIDKALDAAKRSNPQNAKLMLDSLLTASLNAAVVFRTRNSGSATLSLPPALTLSLHEVAKAAVDHGLERSQDLINILYPISASLTKDLQNLPLTTNSIKEEAVKNRTLEIMNKVRLGILSEEDRRELLNAAILDASTAGAHYVKQMETIHFYPVIQANNLSPLNNPSMVAAKNASQAISSIVNNIINGPKTTRKLSPEEQKAQLERSLEFIIDLLDGCLRDDNYFIAESIVSALQPYSANILTLKNVNSWKEAVMLFEADNSYLVQMLMQKAQKEARYPIPPLLWTLNGLKSLSSVKPAKLDLEWATSYVDFYNLFESFKKPLQQMNYPATFETSFFQPLKNLTEQPKLVVGNSNIDIWSEDDLQPLEEIYKARGEQAIHEPVVDYEGKDLGNTKLLMNNDMTQKQAESLLRLNGKTRIAILRSDPITKINWISVKGTNGKIIHKIFNPNFESITKIKNLYKEQLNISFLWKASVEHQKVNILLYSSPFIHQELSTDQIKALLDEAAIEQKGRALVNFSKEESALRIFAISSRGESYSKELPNIYKTNKDIEKLKATLEAGGVKLLEAPARLHTTAEKVSHTFMQL